ncbi:MAG: hypothetical protein ABJZ03_00005 [Marinomonas sp.]
MTSTKAQLLSHFSRRFGSLLSTLGSENRRCGACMAMKLCRASHSGEENAALVVADPAAFDH